MCAFRRPQLFFYRVPSYSWNQLRFEMFTIRKLQQILCTLLMSNMRVFSIIKEIDNTAEFLNQEVSEVEVLSAEMTNEWLCRKLRRALEKV